MLRVSAYAFATDKLVDAFCPEGFCPQIWSWVSRAWFMVHLQKIAVKILLENVTCMTI